jgi:hypothetical protein
MTSAGTRPIRAIHCTPSLWVAGARRLP